MYVIRGKNGMTFESCTMGEEGQEQTYETIESAELAKKQIESSLPFEQFEITNLDEKRS